MLQSIFTMKYGLSVPIYNKCRCILFQESKRYAGHSKWKNIKHTKEANDAAKSILFRNFINKMKIAVAETGDPNPNTNGRLMQLVEQSKKANMPISTLNAFLVRMKNQKEKTQNQIIPIRGPGGCTLILHLSTNNLPLIKTQISPYLKKHGSQYAEPSVLQMFNCACFVVASKDCNFDQAMEDAININASDLQELKDKDKTYFEFKCEFLSSQKSASQLKNLGYSILSMEDVCVPECTTELNEKNLETVERLKMRLESLFDIEKIEDNIAMFEENE